MDNIMIYSINVWIIEKEYKKEDRKEDEYVTSKKYKKTI